MQTPTPTSTAEPVRDATVPERAAAYRLTWPGDQRGVCTVAGQWRRNESGDVEAWYSAAQLSACVEIMKDSEVKR